MSYRKGVAIIILSADSTQILLGERAKEPGQWQIPQGGAEENELILETLERELMEEVGVVLPKVLQQTSGYIRYNWPEGLFKNSKYIGQEHVYFLLDGSGIDLRSLRPTEEFVNFKWFLIRDARDLTVSWKREALSAALRHFELIQ